MLLNIVFVLKKVATLHNQNITTMKRFFDFMCNPYTPKINYPTLSAIVIFAMIIAFSFIYAK